MLYGVGVLGAMGAAVTLGASGVVVGGVTGVVGGILLGSKKLKTKISLKNTEIEKPYIK